MVALSVLGWSVLLASAVLVYKRDWVTRHVTARSLGNLAPGFAATRTGYGLYAALIGDIGIVLIGLGLTDSQPLGGAVVTVGGVLLFILCSAIAIAGEVVTYRALKR